MEDRSQMLRDAGLSVTAQRLSIMKAVEELPHATADMIAERVRSEIGSVSRQAVYNALSMLTEKHLLRRIQPAGSAARYENRVGDNHHHLICRECGLTIDVDCSIGKAPCLKVDNNHGFAIDEAEVVYWGRCPDCQKSKPTK